MISLIYLFCISIPSVNVNIIVVPVIPSTIPFHFKSIRYLSSLHSDSTSKNTFCEYNNMFLNMIFK